MKQSKWLISYAKLNSLDSKFFAERMNVSVSASRSWIVSGLVPRQKYWPGIAQCLGISFSEVNSNYLNQLDDEDRLTDCIVCSAPIIKWTSSIILCRSINCRKTYDLNRKRKQRALLPKIENKSYRSLNYLFNSNEYINETDQDKIKMRKTINEQTKLFLESGNTITVLEPGDAEGTDPISLYLISHGLDHLIDE